MEPVKNKNQTVQVPTGIIENLRIIIASSLLIICFFLPWIEIQWFAVKIINYSGYEITKVASDAENFINAGNEILGIESKTKIANNAYILYLIPIFAGILIYLSYQNFKKYFSFLEIGIFLISGYIFYKLFIDLDMDTKLLGIGLAGTFGISIFMLYEAIKNFNRVQLARSEEVKEISIIFNDIIFIFLFSIYLLSLVYAIFDILIMGN